MCKLLICVQNLLFPVISQTSPRSFTWIPQLFERALNIPESRIHLGPSYTPEIGCPLLKQAPKNESLVIDLFIKIKVLNQILQINPIIYIFNINSCRKPMSNIKYFAFAKSSSTVPIYGYCPEKQNEDEFKLQSGKVLSQLKNLNLRSEERQKIMTSNGCWYCKKDSKGIIYFVLCSTNYPERHIMAGINQVRDHLQKLGEYQSEPDSSLKVHVKGTIQQTCTKYQNLKSVDKVGQIQTNLDQIKTSVSDSTRKIIQNQVQLEQLQKKSEALKDNAFQFSQNATQLERIMYWRNCKLKIIIGFVVVCVITLIVVPIAVK